MSQAVIRLLVVTLFGASFHVKAASDVTTADTSSPSSASSFSASARYHRLAGVRGSDDVLLRNADAIVGARLWLTPGSASRAFVYAEVGATNSTVKWQGLAGI